jgi:hypothetical protein
MQFIHRLKYRRRTHVGQGIADMAGVRAAAGATAIFLYETRIPRRVFGG